MLIILDNFKKLPISEILITKLTMRYLGQYYIAVAKSKPISWDAAKWSTGVTDHVTRSDRYDR